MAFIPLAIPPGIFKQGTEYQAKGRAYDGNLIRWYGAQVGPIKGWRNSGSSTVSGKARAILHWKDNSGGRWSGIGTHTKLYARNSAVQYFDITPSAFVTGDADGAAKTGYGYGVYGAGTYGTARPDTGSSTPATVWDLDTFGQYLNACADSDGRLFEWTLDTGTAAAVITNAPTSCSGLVVTSERALVALGASGNPRKVQWSDFENNTTWSPSSTNKAGDFILQTAGEIKCARRMPGQTFILTTIDAWAMRWVGGVAVYGFDKMGEGCGVYSRGGLTVVSQTAYWWGPQGFWAYDGGVRPLRCDVLDYLQKRLNTAQTSKITSFHNNQDGEVWWFYPSNSGTENDSYVCYCYRTDSWTIGSIERTCAAGQGVYVYPIAFDASGQGYEHEVASSYGGASPTFTYGPVELGNGDSIARVTGIVADEATQGLASVSFTTKFYPNGTETTVATTTLSSGGKTDLRFTARQADLIVTFSNDNSARWGMPRLSVSAGGRR